MNTKSYSPRTDGAVILLYGQTDAEIVRADFARQLETELNEAMKWKEQPMTIYARVKSLLNDSPKISTSLILSYISPFYPKVNPAWLRNQITHYRSQIKRRARKKTVDSYKHF